MIVKRIRMSEGKAKSSSIGDLADYIHAAKDGEKVLHYGQRGMLTTDHATAVREMQALAGAATRSSQPCVHYVLSWREGEQPSAAQAEQAVDLFMGELGLKGHQAIYALHKDTDNIHLHLLLNRVNPETERIVKINNGFDLEAAHKAIARIEAAQGWQREKNARYEQLENGDLVKGAPNKDKPREPGQRPRDMETRTGEKSAQRIGIEKGAGIIKGAQSWQQLHAGLAAAGMRYEKKGSGAIVHVGDVVIKASDIDRSASLSALQKRLGPYEPAPDHLRVASIKPEPIKAKSPGWSQYAESRKTHYAERDAERLALERRHEHERKAMSAAHKRGRDDQYERGDWKGRGASLNAVRSVLAAQQAAERVALKERHKREREQARQRHRPPPDYETWLRQQRGDQAAYEWRYRASERHAAQLVGESSEPPTPRDIRAYSAEIVGNQVHYTRQDQAGGRGGVSFTDAGKQISLHDPTDPSAALAAMQLGAQKWGQVQVVGDDAYKALCVRLAAEHGIRVANPELQEQVKQEQQRRQQERMQAMKSEHLKAFERYSAAVGADRYRVTSIKLRPDGGALAFVLDKTGGVTKGFTPAEIAQRTPEMQRLQNRGENLYYTPLSERKHHVLVDDLSAEKLARLERDGYKPAVVLESSPGNYQAIVTISKTASERDKDAANALSADLNKRYGDPKLSGAIHPHRAPGYENRKPKHARADGTYPAVQITAAQGGECSKARADLAAIAARLEAEAQRAPAQRPVPQMEASAPAAAGPAVAAAVVAYRKHTEAVIKMQRGDSIDASRVDAMVAVRLRVTGHSEGAVAAAIQAVAPTTRTEQTGRDWQDYAQRTARYAFGPAGSAKAADLARYSQQWRALEGQHQQRPQRERQQDYEQMR